MSLGFMEDDTVCQRLLIAIIKCREEHAEAPNQ